MMFDIPNSFNDLYSSAGGSASINSSSVITGLEANKERDEDIHDLFFIAVDELKRIRENFISVFGYSSGKDSTITLLAGLEAHKQLLQEGRLDAGAPFVVCSIDTGVENPFIASLVHYERERLSQYCKIHGINLDFRIAVPPVNKQWLTLFASGHKMLSTARLNNDCSHILKIDNSIVIAKEIKAKYGLKTCTILGTYIKESVRRGAKIKKWGHDKVTPETVEQHGGGRGYTYLPIKDWDVDLVWDCLRRAGDSPEYPTMFPIPSYAPNHRLLRLIYGDAEDRGSCPITADRVKIDSGTTNSVGGCGKSRFGCYTCLKSSVDRSGANMAKLPRYGQCP